MRRTLDGGDATNATPRFGPYRWLLAFNVVMILLIFAEPTISRIDRGAWQRGKFVFENTLSLDGHAVLGYLFVLVFVVQTVLGFLLLGRARLAVVHRWIGRSFVHVAAPLFIGIGLWMILDRGLGLPPERTVVFRRHTYALLIELVQVLVLVTLFLGRGWVAIRRKDLTGHVDAMMTAFIASAMVAGIRGVYAVIWLFGPSPFSVTGVYFITVLVTAVELVVAFTLVGRLRQNLGSVGVLVGSTIVVAVVAAPWYSVWDH